MKKIIALLLVIALTAALSVSLTLAYLQDSDEDVNVMVMGNVLIDLIEQERTYDASGNVTGLKSFSQYKEMYPIVGSAQADATSSNFDKYGMTKAGNFVDKIISVKNTGKNDAWIRVLVAKPAALMPVGVAQSDFALHGSLGNRVDLSGNYTDPAGDEWQETWQWDWQNTNTQYITVGETEYRVDCYWYKVPVKSGEQTSAVIAGFYLDSRVNYDENTGTYTMDGKDTGFSGPVQIPVIAQAVQVSGFDSYTDAFNAAFPYGKDNVNLIQWFNDAFSEPFAKVTILGKNDTLKNEGGNIILSENLTIDTKDSNMGLDFGELSLNTAYQFEPNMTYEEGDVSEYADWHADFVVSVNQDIPAYGIGLAGYYDAWCSSNNGKWVMLASDAEIKAGTEIRLVDAMGNGGITVSYRELCNFGNDGIGFLCGAVDLSGQMINGQTVADIAPGTTITVELRLYEATGGSRDTETGEYITTGVYTYTFE